MPGVMLVSGTPAGELGVQAPRPAVSASACAQRSIASDDLASELRTLPVVTTASSSAADAAKAVRRIKRRADWWRLWRRGPRQPGLWQY